MQLTNINEKKIHKLTLNLSDYKILQKFTINLRVILSDETAK